MSDVWVAVLVAVVTGAFALAGQIVLSRNSNQKMLSEIEKRSEISDIKIEGQIDKMKGVWDVKLTQLTDSVNKHNGFAERIPVLEEKIRTMEGRLSELERMTTHHEHT